MQQLMRPAAEQLLQAREASGPAACRVMHRLAYYADTLYKGIQLQRASPEWDTVRGFIETKQKQVGGLPSALQLLSSAAGELPALMCAAAFLRSMQQQVSGLPSLAQLCEPILSSSNQVVCPQTTVSILALPPATGSWPAKEMCSRQSLLGCLH